jgi:hypothetical protein
MQSLNQESKPRTREEAHAQMITAFRTLLATMDQTHAQLEALVARVEREGLPQ